MARKSKDLPGDMEMDILLRLPVKSLLRFRCVCKPWCTTFQTQLFITNHYLKQNSLHKITNNANVSVLAFRHDKHPQITPDHNNENIIVLDVLDETLNVKENIHLPLLKHTRRTPRIMGPCNGLICFLDKLNDITLWNPATREFKHLPVSDIERPSCAEITDFYNFGFGFDSKTNDYKVIAMIYNFYKVGDSFKSIRQVEVYTLSTNSWREISGVECLAHSRTRPEDDAYINGVYHWMVSCGNDILLTFDIANEVFSTLPLPLNFDSGYMWKIASLNESLAVINYNQWGMENSFDIWVMKEYGVKESWIKQLTTEPLFDIGQLLRSPLGFWKNGGLFLISRDKQLVLYNPSTQDIQKLQVHSHEELMRVIIYVESLVQINGRREYEDELFIRLPTDIGDV